VAAESDLHAATDQRQAFAAVGERMAWADSHVERSVAGAVALDLSWQVTPITIATRYMVTSARVALMLGISTMVRWWGFVEPTTSPCAVLNTRCLLETAIRPATRAEQSAEHASSRHWKESAN
jgi:hypothetical protein